MVLVDAHVVSLQNIRNNSAKRCGAAFSQTILMSNLTFQYPVWYISFCAILGLAFALFLYFRSNAFPEKPKLNVILGALRWLATTLIAILLLSPIIKTFETEVKKPIVVLAQDQSESIAAGTKPEALEAYKKDFNRLSERLREKYDVKEYRFGSEVAEGVNFQFKDKTSNLSDVLKNAFDLYGSQHLGAVILATDGIYNEGSNPTYAAPQMNAPVFTIALGDTTVKKDLLLRRVFHNKIAYLGDKFSVQADIAARNCKGNTTLTVKKIADTGEKVLSQTAIAINQPDFFVTKDLILDADQPGTQRYRLELTKVEGEITTVNNTKDIFVDVLDARQKILILGIAPHPDIASLHQTLAQNKNYQVTTTFLKDLTGSVSNYNFVILHQLPGIGNDAVGILKQLNDKKIPRLFIAGAQSDLAQLNRVQPLVTINGDGANTSDVQANVVGSFKAFTLEPKILQEIPKFIPLTAPFGDFREQPNAQVLLYQRIGKVDTKYPLLALGEQNGSRVGILCAEGIWKWRLFDFMQHQNHAIFDDFLGKTITYLSVKEDKRKFRVNVAKNLFYENEAISFEGELYNDSYELINDSDVSMTIKNKEGKDFTYTFNKSGRAYRLDVGFLAVGNYTFKAMTNVNGAPLTYDGQFSVLPIQQESYETTANHALLRLLSRGSGGETVMPNQLEVLFERIQTKNSLKPIMYQTAKANPVINIKWIFFALFLLLAIEWFLRRYFGGY